MKKALVLMLLTGVLAACQQDPTAEWKETDLLPYGLPISLMAPDSVEIKATNNGPYRDVTLKKDDSYYVQIFAYESQTTDLAQLKAEQLEAVKNQYFQGIVKEEEAGFIFKSAIDSTYVNYGFRYVMVRGDREYVFQNGLVGSYTLEQVQHMYDGLKPREK